MSVSMVQAPVPHTSMKWSQLAEGKRLSFLGTSFAEVHKAMLETFGKFPIRLELSHVQTMRAMAAAAGAGGKPYTDMADALERFSNLEITLVD